jgi:hypothetical protein
MPNFHCENAKCIVTSGVGDINLMSINSAIRGLERVLVENGSRLDQYLSLSCLGNKANTFDASREKTR